ncbi:replication initiation protein RepC [Gymnodinialimonas sp. 2305UL16-5]|uniref:replication initiation protein RepC n=1 Tax=Gymnodinialimonas mytili TaxID=3126503 RepID=UPI00309C37A1
MGSAQSIDHPSLSDLEKHVRLPENMTRDAFLRILRSVRPHLAQPVSAAALETFLFMAEATRPRDWTSSEKAPCCYMAQTEIAKMRGRSPSVIRKHETELVRAGLIEKRTSANGARSGFLHCGIYFTPAIRSAAHFEAVLHHLQQERLENGYLRGRFSTSKRFLTSILGEVFDLCPDHSEAQEVETAFDQMPTASEQHRMSIDSLERLVKELDTLVDIAEDLLKNCAKTIARPLKNKPPYIQDTTQDSASVSCNANVKKESAQARSYLEKQGGGDGRLVQSHRIHEPDFLAKLTPPTLFGMAAPGFQLELRKQRDDVPSLTIRDFVGAAMARLQPLGVHPSAWDEAVDLVTPETAALCILIIDAHLNSGDIAILNNGAYFRGMVRKARSGDLHIIRSLIGIAERNRIRDKS